MATIRLKDNRSFRRLVFSRLAALSVIVCFAAAAIGEESATPKTSAPKKQSIYLITDYLPSAIYDGDSITACFRVENTTGAEVALDFQVAVSDETGKSGSDQTENIKAPTTGFAQIQKTLSSTHCSKLQFTLKQGAEVAGLVTLRLVRAEDPWPAGRFRDGRLETKDNGEIVVAVVKKRLKVQNRAFAPLKWVTGTTQQTQSAASRKLTCVPGRWQLDATKLKQAVLTLGPYQPNGAPPVLEAAGDILAKVASLQSGLAGNALRLVICLPPEDLDVATDPRVYRTILEALLARLEAAGIKDVVLVPPLHFGAPEVYCQALWHEIHEAAATYQVKSADPADYLDEKLWRVDPAQSGVYGLRPNSTGLDKLTLGLAGLLP